jgi:hypothetical protein
LAMAVIISAVVLIGLPQWRNWPQPQPVQSEQEQEQAGSVRTG